MPPFVRARLDYYAMLEIDPSADTGEINAAFRRMAWRYHPDRNPAPGSTLQFQDINEAHQVLSDPARRAQYDAEWHPEAAARQANSRPSVRSRSYRSPHRRRFRTGVLAVCALMVVPSAWALIFLTVRSAYYSKPKEISYALSSSYSADVSPNLGLTMEMFPVSYIDESGRRETAWETDIRNWWGGSTRILSVPNISQHRSGNEFQRPSQHFGLISR
jgi:curved DNA-binding protein CbpA